MTDAALRRQIQQIPGGDGWWRTSGEDAYLDLAVRLREHGVPPDVALDVLRGAFHAAAAEYGD
ncbi:hypothetical protein GCM10022379_18520 [Micromonospora maritima]